MLKLKLQGHELYDEVNECFIQTEDFELELEHSLLSVSKWESKFQKPFLGPGVKSKEEALGYIEAMIISKEYPDDLFFRLTNEHFEIINKYIESNHSATTFGLEDPKKPKGRSEIITSELIYYWMVAYGIPFECETWNLNRLFALIKICNVKNSKEKKMSRHEIAARNRALNEQRKAQLGTTG